MPEPQRIPRPPTRRTRGLLDPIRNPMHTRQLRLTQQSQPDRRQPRLCDLYACEHAFELSHILVARNPEGAHIRKDGIHAILQYPHRFPHASY